MLRARRKPITGIVVHLLGFDSSPMSDDFSFVKNGSFSSPNDSFSLSGDSLTLSKVSSPLSDYSFLCQGGLLLAQITLLCRMIVS